MISSFAIGLLVDRIASTSSDRSGVADDERPESFATMTPSRIDERDGHGTWRKSNSGQRLARATAAFSNRLAPGTERASIASLTLWLMPSWHGVKIIAVGAMVATA